MMTNFSPNFFDGKTILITGHTGFKGSWLSIWLHKLKANVVGYALAPMTTPNLYEICGLDKVILSIIGDIRNLRTLKEALKNYKPEIVFHMAAQSLVRYSYMEPVETYETNIMGTVNLFEACRHTPSVKVIVNVTSDKCYENQEWIWGYRENDPVGGYDPYSNSKACSELITAAYRNSFFNPKDYNFHGVALASARAGNSIGGGDWAADRLIPDCIRALMKGEKIIIRNPHAIRPWQHVLESLSGYLLLAQKLYEDGPRYAEAWNFGPHDSNVKPVEWIVKRICAKWGNNTSYEIESGGHLHEAHYLKLDYSKAKTELKWSPKWDLEKAVDSIVEWLVAYKEGSDLLEMCIKQIREYSKIIDNE